MKSQVLFNNQLTEQENACQICSFLLFCLKISYARKDSCGKSSLTLRDRLLGNTCNVTLSETIVLQTLPGDAGLPTVLGTLCLQEPDNWTQGTELVEMGPDPQNWTQIHGTRFIGLGLIPGVWVQFCGSGSCCTGSSVPVCWLCWSGYTGLVMQVWLVLSCCIDLICWSANEVPVWLHHSRGAFEMRVFCSCRTLRCGFKMVSEDDQPLRGPDQLPFGREGRHNIFGGCSLESAPAPCDPSSKQSFSHSIKKQWTRLTRTTLSILQMTPLS